MKHLRILAVTVMIAALGTVCAFAEEVSAPFYIKALYWAVYIVPIAIIAFAFYAVIRFTSRHNTEKDSSKKDR